MENKNVLYFFVHCNLYFFVHCKLNHYGRKNIKTVTAWPSWRLKNNSHNIPEQVILSEDTTQVLSGKNILIVRSEGQSGYSTTTICLLVLAAYFPFTLHCVKPLQIRRNR